MGPDAWTLRVNGAVRAFATVKTGPFQPSPGSASTGQRAAGFRGGPVAPAEETRHGLEA
jgi:hypothetical protein